MAKKNDKQVPDGETVVGTGNDTRLKMLDEINDRNDEALAEEGALAEINDDDTTTVIPANATDEQIAQRELKRFEREAGQKPVEEPQKVKVKINGQEEELTIDELTQLAEKAQGADLKFREAARLRTEAEEIRRQATQPPEKDAAQQAVEERRALVRAIQMGTEDEAMAAIEKLQGRTIQSVTPDEVARTIDERLTFNEAVARFKDEFEDIVSDPVLLNIVLARDKELIGQGDTRNYWERYESIGNEVRDWMSEKTKVAAPAERQDKMQRKAAAPTVPQAASAKAPEAVDEEDIELSPSEIIANMAKARGGPQFMR